MCEAFACTPSQAAYELHGAHRPNPNGLVARLLEMRAYAETKRQLEDEHLPEDLRRLVQESALAQTIVEIEAELAGLFDEGEP